jgi:hypothetical protein
LLSFRNSIGDITLPGYEAYSSKGEFEDHLVIYIMWILWFVQLLIMQIILLNFLIAVISQTYERVASSQVNYIYKDKAEMNEECQLILSTLYYVGEVKMIVFTYDKSIFSVESDAWGGIVDQVKQVVDKSASKIRNKIESFQKNVESNVVEMKKA